MNRRPRQERSGCRRWGWHAACVDLQRRWGAPYFGWFSPTVVRTASGTRGSGLSAVYRRALRLLDGGEFHQVSHLAVKIPLGLVLRGDVLARAKLLGESHAGVVDDVAVDPARALTCGTCGVYPL